MAYRVLLIDSNPKNVTLTRQRLREIGLVVDPETVENVEQALQRLRSGSSYNLLIYGMNEDNLPITDILKLNEEFPNIKLLPLYGDPNPESTLFDRLQAAEEKLLPSTREKLFGMSTFSARGIVMDQLPNHTPGETIPAVTALTIKVTENSEDIQFLRKKLFFNNGEESLTTQVKRNAEKTEELYRMLKQISVDFAKHIDTLESRMNKPLDDAEAAIGRLQDMVVQKNGTVASAKFSFWGVIIVALIGAGSGVLSLQKDNKQSISVEQQKQLIDAINANNAENRRYIVENRKLIEVLRQNQKDKPKSRS